MVASKRFFSESSYYTENSATNTAASYIFTLPHIFAMDARQILQQWKQIVDNLSTQLVLKTENGGPQVATNANTRNLEVLLPSYARPVAEVAQPPPGAAVEVSDVDPMLPRPATHMQAAHDPRVPAYAGGGAGGNMAQRRREQHAFQNQAYVPPE